ncbi:unnamed protein product [Rhizoctonia solani]|uniref:Uncharacterized protein n=1 Tax=Rhizoctonia solani TaxID=456999 RepID=A0A8H3AAI7_9AGAM|nr:unnamed protein product [Rhizoctonia solani]
MVALGHYLAPSTPLFLNFVPRSTISAWLTHGNIISLNYAGSASNPQQCGVLDVKGHGIAAVSTSFVIGPVIRWSVWLWLQ